MDKGDVYCLYSPQAALGNRGKENNPLFKDGARDSSHKRGKNPKQISRKEFKQVG